MLVEFRVTNVRSLKAHQTLSLVASSSAEHRDTHVIHPAAPATPDLLRAAVIYGPNASGKSNLILALAFMKRFVCESSGKRNPSDITGVTPYAFDPITRDEPSSFEVIAIVDGRRFQYGFVLDQTRVLEEWLIVYASSKGQTWYERRWDETSHSKHYETKFGPQVRGEKVTWERSTRPNALLLSTAVQLNAESLMPFHRWFSQVLRIIRVGSDAHRTYTMRQCEDKATHDRVLRFLQSADLNITRVSVERDESNEAAYPDGMLASLLRTPPNDKVYFHHPVRDGEPVALDLDDESDGTRKLFALAGPLLDVLEHGNVLFVDELDTSLHPAVVRLIIGLFHNPTINAKGAQLVFSTHDTSVLDKDVFRRDQVWFVEADGLGASTVYPLTDFHPRKGENLEKGYLNGRYGALPFIGGLRFDTNDG